MKIRQKEGHREHRCEGNGRNRTTRKRGPCQLPRKEEWMATIRHSPQPSSNRGATPGNDERTNALGVHCKGGARIKR